MKGFRKFLLRGNVVDLAVGVVIGAAFTGVVKGFTDDFLNPLLSFFVGNQKGVNWGTITLGSGKGAPVINYSDFVNVAITFLITAAVVYFLVVLPVNKLSSRFITKTDVEAPKKDCPECLSSIPEAATRCSFCTIPLPVHAVSFPKQ